MRMPRISIQTILAVVIVVAADCMVCRSILTRREGGLTGQLYPLLFVGLPMMNLLAIAAACWIRDRRTLGSFCSGFTVIGLVALGASVIWVNPILDWWESTLTRVGLIAWVGQSSSREFLMIVVIALISPQVLVGSIGGGLSRWLGRHKSASLDIASPRRKLAALIAMAAIVAIPAVGTEVYLFRTSDQKIARLAVNSEALVVVKQLPIIKQVVPVTAPPRFRAEPVPQLALGTRLKVDHDDEPSIIQCTQVGDSEAVEGDYRMVRVTVLDGEHARSTWTLPRYAIQSSR